MLFINYVYSLYVMPHQPQIVFHTSCFQATCGAAHMTDLIILFSEFV